MMEMALQQLYDLGLKGLPKTALVNDWLFVKIWRGPGYRKVCRYRRRAEQRRRAKSLVRVRQEGTSVAYPYPTGFTYNLYFGGER